MEDKLAPTDPPPIAETCLQTIRLLADQLTVYTDGSATAALGAMSQQQQQQRQPLKCNNISCRTISSLATANRLRASLWAPQCLGLSPKPPCNGSKGGYLQSLHRNSGKGLMMTPGSLFRRTLHDQLTTEEPLFRHCSECTHTNFECRVYICVR